MSALHFELVSPASLLISGEVAQVVVPGAEGFFTVLANHAPMVATLKPGVLEVRRSEGEAERIFVRGGFAEVNGKGLTVLAEEAVPVKDLRPGHIAQAIQNAQEDVKDAQGDDAKRAAQENLDHLKALEQALS